MRRTYGEWADTVNNLPYDLGLVDMLSDWQADGIRLTKCINNLEARIAELEAAQRWIPVSEPPKIDGTYLVRNICTDVYSCNFIADTNTWVLSWYDSITHWMPLPKFPEVQE